MGTTGTTTATELVETEDEGGVRILRLSRPPVNALNLEVAQAMHGAVTADAESPLFAGAIDRVRDAAELRDAAVAEARRLVAIRAFGRVKHQLRTATIERLEQIVARDAEPLLTHWV